MTQIEVVVGLDGEMSIKATGHTKSVVCASVSTLMQSSVRFMQELAEQYPEDLQVNIKYERSEREMGLKKQDLLDTFDKARETEASFVFVEVSAEGTEEIIAIPRKSFDAKEQFYDKAYNDNLVHVMNSKVSIQGVHFGQAAKLQDLYYVD